MPTLEISKDVGKDLFNNADDVKAVANWLIAIGKLDSTFNSDGTLDDKITDGIKSAQSHWMLNPDGLITIGSETHEFFRKWEEKDTLEGVDLTGGQLQKAWDILNPLLPAGSRCSSGYRRTELQRQILQGYWISRKSIILQKMQLPEGGIAGRTAAEASNEYDRLNMDLTGNETSIFNWVRKAKITIALPGTSPHEKHEAFDISGAGLDAIALAARKVAAANPTIFKAPGKILKETNQNCVHVEVKK